MIDSKEATPIRIFAIEPRLRLKQTGIFAVQLLAISFGTYTLFKIIFDHSISFHYFSSCLFVIFTAHLCYRYNSWGDTIQFGKSEIVFLKNQYIKSNIQLDRLKEIKVKKRTVTFVYQDNEHIKFKLVGRLGFSDAKWQAFTEYTRRNGKNSKRFT